MFDCNQRQCRRNACRPCRGEEYPISPRPPVVIPSVTPPSFSQGTAVADATGADDVVTQLNALLASLRTAGIIAK